MSEQKTGTQPEKQVNGKTKKLTLLNVVAAMFTSIFLIDSIVPAASAGSSTVIWYLIIGVAFYIPYGLITAEFSSKIPDEGGVYAWVKKTLGIGTAKRVSWYYWVNVGIWAPSIALYMSQLVVYMWIPGLETYYVAEPGTTTAAQAAAYNWITAIMAIGFMWASLAFSYFPLADNIKIYNIATLGKITIVFFLISGSIIYLASGNNSETDFSKIPDEFANTGALLLFLPALVYNILGLETIAGEASNIKDPKKTMGRATIITTLSLLVFYIITTLAVQVLFDTANGLDLTGIMIGLENVFGGMIVEVIGVIFLFTMFVETMGWVSGANAGISESSENKEVPQIFGWNNKLGMPFKSTVILGAIGTLELLLFTGLGTIVEPSTVGGGALFWSLFAASSNILFLSYFLMFAAYIKAKITGELDNIEGFSNNKIIGISLAIMASIVLAITWFLLLWSPGYNVITQTVPIIISVVVAMGAGELCFMLANRQYRGNIFKGEKGKGE